jgi:hypothetical protein
VTPVRLSTSELIHANVQFHASVVFTLFEGHPLSTHFAGGYGRVGEENAQSRTPSSQVQLPSLHWIITAHVRNMINSLLCV